jgi:hypothetical protein
VQIPPSTLIGTPTADRVPVPPKATASPPPARAACPVANTSALRSCPPAPGRRPADTWVPALLQPPATSTAPPGS